MDINKGPYPSFTQGKESEAYQYLGSHAHQQDGVNGYRFRTWAPKATKVAVVGDFNGWATDAHPMAHIGDGIWEGFVPNLAQYDCYKYAITGPDGEERLKADPYAVHAETRPGTASKIYTLAGYPWGDQAWSKHRQKHLVYNSPLNVYEVHLGSWRKTGEDTFLSYRDIAQQLVPYVKEMGFTHVELMPITEHPLDDSWGYQCTGYFAATSRFGTPHDLMYLIDQLHQAGVGVILDWVPAHFPKDAFGLYEYDGTPTYEYGDPRKGEHADWGTRVFDYGRNEVRSFLLSSAEFWVKEFHIDGLRVDAVASMLYLDYSREGGDWCPNIYGGNQNLEAVTFFQELNCQIFARHPDCLMIAEESTAWAGVTRPVDCGGLGFNLKWNMGWSNDSLRYIEKDPVYRQFNHRDITFSMIYAFTENFLLPISHDEVVHGKGALLAKMPGEDPLKFAGVRAYYTYMMAHPGKKLTMMGTEFGQWREWTFRHSLDWHLLEWEPHRQLQRFFQAANNLYLTANPLWELDFSGEGFQWLCEDDPQNNCLAFLRRDTKGDTLVALCNFSPLWRSGYEVGVPWRGLYEEVFSSDRTEFGGSGFQNNAMETADTPRHGQGQAISLTLPPMSAIFLRCTEKYHS